MKYLIPIFFLLVSCKKINTEPEAVKKALTVFVKGSGYLSEFKVNKQDVTSPAIVYSGDNVSVRIVTYDVRATVNYTVSLDGVVLYSAINSKGYNSSFDIK